MDKCLVTTLQGSVEDVTGLEKFGEGSIILPSSGGTVKCAISPLTAIKNLGGSNYSSDTLTWTSSATVILNKYAINKFSIYNQYDITQDFLDQMLKVTEYSPLEQINITAKGAEKLNINAFKNTKLASSVSFNTDFKLEGQAEELINKCVNSGIIVIQKTTGTTKVFINEYTFAIDKLNKNNLPNLKIMQVKDTDGLINGNLVNLPPACNFISFKGSTNTNLTWTGTRDASSPIIAMESVVLGSYVDAMLIEQATHSNNPSGSESWYNAIDVTGTRTSASDSAVETLKSKGITVRINNVTL